MFPLCALIFPVKVKIRDGGAERVDAQQVVEARGGSARHSTARAKVQAVHGEFVTDHRVLSLQVGA